ncbi:hypothetical protein [Sphingomonas sp. 8AM]|uniref:hypothetical protein n=1 Tax=Sphingomonas sp. 8AM TaxID=2653170 RepID=UPI001356AA77|nr:hypothetical protein [Sphingomonas sp. 8AM]
MTLAWPDRPAADQEVPTMTIRFTALRQSLLSVAAAFAGAAVMISAAVPVTPIA